MIKVCTRCGIKKDISCFYKGNCPKDGLSYTCKDCEKIWVEGNKEKLKKYYEEYYKQNREKARELAKEYYICNADIIKAKSRQYYSNNKEKVFESAKKYYKKNKDKILIAKREYHKKNKDKIKKYYEKNKEKIREKHKIYLKKHYRENLDKYKEWSKNWRINNRDRKNEAEYNRRHNNPEVALSHLISGDILRSLKGNKNRIHWETLVGYTLQDLMNHLESKFQDGMTWENRGLCGWHIDHFRPISSFNFTSYEDEQFKKCWALSNLQPLWAFDNLSKGAKILPQPSREGEKSAKT